MIHYFLLHKYIIKNKYTRIRNEYNFIKKIGVVAIMTIIYCISSKYVYHHLENKVKFL